MDDFEREISGIDMYLETKSYPPGCDQNSRRSLRRRANQFKMGNRRGQLFYGEKREVVTSKVEQIIRETHEGIGGSLGYA